MDMTQAVTKTDTLTPATDADLSQWRRPADLARLLGVTRVTIYRWMAENQKVETRHLSDRIVQVRLRPESLKADGPGKRTRPRSSKPKSTDRKKKR